MMYKYPLSQTHAQTHVHTLLSIVSLCEHIYTCIHVNVCMHTPRAYTNTDIQNAQIISTRTRTDTNTWIHALACMHAEKYRHVHTGINGKNVHALMLDLMCIWMWCIFILYVSMLVCSYFYVLVYMNMYISIVYLYRLKCIFMYTFI